MSKKPRESTRASVDVRTAVQMAAVIMAAVYFPIGGFALYSTWEHSKQITGLGKDIQRVESAANLRFEQIQGEFHWIRNHLLERIETGEIRATEKEKEKLASMASMIATPFPRQPPGADSEASTEPSPWRPSAGPILVLLGASTLIWAGIALLRDSVDIAKLFRRVFAEPPGLDKGAEPTVGAQLASLAAHLEGGREGGAGAPRELDDGVRTANEPTRR